MSPTPPSTGSGTSKVGSAKTSCTTKKCTITSKTIASSPSNRARTRIAVGEEVELTVSPGTATWSISTGTGKLSSTSGTKVTFTADDKAGSVNITANSSGCSCKIQFTIVIPSSFTMKREPGTNLKHTRNRPNCGWFGVIFVHSNDVNFYNIQVREKDSKCVSSGSHSVFKGLPHGRYPPPDYASSWLTISMSTHSSSDGSKVNTSDNIDTGDPGIAAGAVPPHGTAPPFIAGEHHYPITFQWRVKGKTSIYDFPVVRQEAEVFTNGKCESRKGGNTEPTMYSDPTSTR